MIYEHCCAVPGGRGGRCSLVIIDSKRGDTGRSKETMVRILGQPHSFQHQLQYSSTRAPLWSAQMVKDVGACCYCPPPPQAASLQPIAPEFDSGIKPTLIGFRSRPPLSDTGLSGLASELFGVSNMS